MPEADREHGGAFPETRWSLIGRAGLDGGTVQRVALTTLVERYLPALRCHLIYRKRIAPDKAEDLLQGFLLHKVLEQNLPGKADRERGRFRSLLLTALDRFVLNESRHAKAQIRSAKDEVSLEGRAEPADRVVRADSFDIAWARQVLRDAIKAMRQECQASGRADVWGVFEARVLRPALHGAEPVAYADLVRQFGFTTPAQASNVLITANRMFQRHLHGVVGQYETEDQDIDAEIAELREILAGSRAGAAGGSGTD